MSELVIFWTDGHVILFACRLTFLGSLDIASDADQLQMLASALLAMSDVSPLPFLEKFTAEMMHHEKQLRRPFADSCRYISFRV